MIRSGRYFTTSSTATSAICEVLSGTDNSGVESLVDPVLERFDQTLGNIAEEHSELEPRCSDLARKIKSLREPPTPVSP